LVRLARLLNEIEREDIVVNIERQLIVLRPKDGSTTGHVRWNGRDEEWVVVE
jgi:hypothetical protein